MKIRYEHAPHGKPGWCIKWQPFRRGGGYRAYDFPWHSMKAPWLHPWWSRRFRSGAWWSYIPGYTLTIGHRGREIHSRKLRRFYVSWSKKGNPKRQCVPRWW